MEKERKILFNFTSYILLGLLICLIGLSNVFAATYYTDYGYSQQYYDNNGSSLTTVSTSWNESLQSYVSGNITTVANSYGAGLSITSPIPIINNHTYTISIYFEERNNIALSSKPSIALGNSLSSASYNYSISNYWADTIQSTVSNNQVLQYVFKATGNSNFLFIPWTTNSTTTASYVLTSINMEDLGSEGISQEDINNSLNNQTNIINDSINNLGEDIKDSINDNFNSCRPGYNLLQYTTTQNTSLNGLTFIFNDDKSITVNGTATSATVFDFISGTNIYLDGGMYTFSGSVGGSNSTYFMEAIVGPNNTYFHSINGSETLSLVDGSYLFRAYIFVANGAKLNNVTFKPMFEKGTIAHKYEPYTSEEICSNKIDETNDKLDETNDKLNDLNQSLTDSSPTDMSGLGDSAGWLPAGPVDSILTLPLTMLNSLVNNLTSNSCQTLNIELPFVKENLTLPCVKSLYDKMGVTGTLFTTAGLIASAFILFNYLLNLYQWVDSTLTMRENTMPGYFDDNWGGGA